MRPKISVLLPVYNCCKHVAASINSILNQSFTDIELIIIDGGSTDCTLNVVRSFRDERIRVFTHTERMPLIESLNEGIHVANACLIARQDADDISQPQRLASQYERFCADKNLVVLGTACFCVDEAGRFIGKAFPKEKVVFTDFKRNNEIRHGSVMFRKDVILKEGLYDPLFREVEDYELWCRLSQKNYKIANLSEFLYTYRLHKSSLSERNYQESILWYCIVEEVYFGGLEKTRIDAAFSWDFGYLYNLLSPETRKEYHRHLIAHYMTSKKYLHELREFWSLTKIDPRESSSLLREIMLERARLTG